EVPPQRPCHQIISPPEEQPPHQERRVQPPVRPGESASVEKGENHSKPRVKTRGLPPGVSGSAPGPPGGTRGGGTRTSTVASPRAQTGASTAADAARGRA